MADILGSQNQIISEVRRIGTPFAVASGSLDGAIPLHLGNASTVAAAANNQTLTGAAGLRTYITDFYVDGLGATAASIIAVTITGLLGGTRTYRVSIPAGVGVPITRLQVNFTFPIPASADGTSITVNVPSYGAGNTAADAGVSGFRI